MTGDFRGKHMAILTTVILGFLCHHGQHQAVADEIPSSPVDSADTTIRSDPGPVRWVGTGLSKRLPHLGIGGRVLLALSRMVSL